VVRPLLGCPKKRALGRPLNEMATASPELAVCGPISTATLHSRTATIGDRADGPTVEPTDPCVGVGLRYYEVTLRTWRNAALIEGSLVRKDSGQSERWSGPEKFRIVLESAPMNEAELSEYCRRKGFLNKTRVEQR
jgi:hypothetical protein